MELGEIIILVVQVIQFFLYLTLKSYFEEKGKNLATKEDIKEITRRVEEIKDEFLKGQTKFNKLHEIRIEVLRELNKKLRILNYDIQGELSELHNSDSKGVVYHKIMIILNEFRYYHEDNEIFFEDNFNKKLVELYNKYFESATNIKIGAEREDRYNKMYSDDDKIAEAMEKVDKGWDLIWHEIPKFRKEINDEMKKILGSITSE